MVHDDDVIDFFRDAEVGMGDTHSSPTVLQSKEESPKQLGLPVPNQYSSSTAAGSATVPPRFRFKQSLPSNISTPAKVEQSTSSPNPKAESITPLGPARGTAGRACVACVRCQSLSFIYSI
jgi:hypothetical protein